MSAGTGKKIRALWLEMRSTTINPNEQKRDRGRSSSTERRLYFVYFMEIHQRSGVP